MTTGLQVMMTRFTERLQERLNRANATPNDLPREGEKNVSFSICLLVVKSVTWMLTLSYFQVMKTQVSTLEVP